MVYMPAHPRCIRSSNGAVTDALAVVGSRRRDLYIDRRRRARLKYPETGVEAL
jgi:hypothetical protein